MKETSEVLQSLVSANFLSIDEARAILADKDPQVGAALSRNGNGVNKMVAHGTAEVTISTSPVVKARNAGIRVLCPLGKPQRQRRHAKHYREAQGRRPKRCGSDACD